MLVMKNDLGVLGYPGFSYLRGRPKRNPVQLLFYALNQPDLDIRRGRRQVQVGDAYRGKVGGVDLVGLQAPKVIVAGEEAA
jgi:hypothetical protein